MADPTYPAFSKVRADPRYPQLDPDALFNSTRRNYEIRKKQHEIATQWLQGAVKFGERHGKTFSSKNFVRDAQILIPELDPGQFYDDETKALDRDFRFAKSRPFDVPDDEGNTSIAGKMIAGIENKLFNQPRKIPAALAALSGALTGPAIPLAAIAQRFDRPPTMALKETDQQLLNTMQQRFLEIKHKEGQGIPLTAIEKRVIEERNKTFGNSLRSREHMMRLIAKEEVKEDIQSLYDQESEDVLLSFYGDIREEDLPRPAKWMFNAIGESLAEGPIAGHGLNGALTFVGGASLAGERVTKSIFGIADTLGIPRGPFAEWMAESFRAHSDELLADARVEQRSDTFMKSVNVDLQKIVGQLSVEIPMIHVIGLPAFFGAMGLGETQYETASREQAIEQGLIGFGMGKSFEAIFAHLGRIRIGTGKGKDRLAEAGIRRGVGGATFPATGIVAEEVGSILDTGGLVVPHALKGDEAHRVMADFILGAVLSGRSKRPRDILTETDINLLNQVNQAYKGAEGPAIERYITEGVNILTKTADDITIDEIAVVWAKNKTKRPLSNREQLIQLSLMTMTDEMAIFGQISRGRNMIADHQDVVERVMRNNITAIRDKADQQGIGTPEDIQRKINEVSEERKQKAENTRQEQGQKKIDDLNAQIDFWDSQIRKFEKEDITPEELQERTIQVVREKDEIHNEITAIEKELGREIRDPFAPGDNIESGGRLIPNTPRTQEITEELRLLPEVNASMSRAEVNAAMAKDPMGLVILELRGKIKKPKEGTPERDFVGDNIRVDLENPDQIPKMFWHTNKSKGVGISLEEAMLMANSLSPGEFPADMSFSDFASKLGNNTFSDVQLAIQREQGIVRAGRLKRGHVVEMPGHFRPFVVLGRDKDGRITMVNDIIEILDPSDTLTADNLVRSAKPDEFLIAEARHFDNLPKELRPKDDSGKPVEPIDLEASEKVLQPLEFKPESVRDNLDIAENSITTRLADPDVSAADKKFLERQKSIVQEVRTQIETGEISLVGAARTLNDLALSSQVEGIDLRMPRIKDIPPEARSMTPEEFTELVELVGEEVARERLTEAAIEKDRLERPIVRGKEARPVPEGPKNPIAEAEADVIRSIHPEADSLQILTDVVDSVKDTLDRGRRGLSDRQIENLEAIQKESQKALDDPAAAVKGLGDKDVALFRFANTMKERMLENNGQIPNEDIRSRFGEMNQVSKDVEQAKQDALNPPAVTDQPALDPFQEAIQKRQERQPEKPKEEEPKEFTLEQLDKAEEINVRVLEGELTEAEADVLLQEALGRKPTEAEADEASMQRIVNDTDRAEVLLGDMMDLTARGGIRTGDLFNKVEERLEKLADDLEGLNAEAGKERPLSEIETEATQLADNLDVLKQRMENLKRDDTPDARAEIDELIRFIEGRPARPSDAIVRGPPRDILEKTVVEFPKEEQARLDEAFPPRDTISPWEMTREELIRLEERLEEATERLEEEVMGERPKQDDFDRVEESGTPFEQAAVFGIGLKDAWTVEDIAEINREVNLLDIEPAGFGGNATDLGRSLSRLIANLNAENLRTKDILELADPEIRALTAFRIAEREAKELGLDMAEVNRAFIEGAIIRFGEDADFMINSFLGRREGDAPRAPEIPVESAGERLTPQSSESKATAPQERAGLSFEGTVTNPAFEPNHAKISKVKGATIIDERGKWRWRDAKGKLIPGEGFDSILEATENPPPGFDAYLDAGRPIANIHTPPEILRALEEAGFKNQGEGQGNSSWGREETGDHISIFFSKKGLKDMAASISLTLARKDREHELIDFFPNAREGKFTTEEAVQAIRDLDKPVEERPVEERPAAPEEPDLFAAAEAEPTPAQAEIAKAEETVKSGGKSEISENVLGAIKSDELAMSQEVARINFRLEGRVQEGETGFKIEEKIREKDQVFENANSIHDRMRDLIALAESVEIIPEEAIEILRELSERPATEILREWTEGDRSTFSTIADLNSLFGVIVDAKTAFPKAERIQHDRRQAQRTIDDIIRANKKAFLEDADTPRNRDAFDELQDLSRRVDRSVDQVAREFFDPERAADMDTAVQLSKNFADHAESFFFAADFSAKNMQRARDLTDAIEEFAGRKAPPTREAPPTPKAVRENVSEMRDRFRQKIDEQLPALAKAAKKIEQAPDTQPLKRGGAAGEHISSFVAAAKRIRIETRKLFPKKRKAEDTTFSETTRIFGAMEKALELFEEFNPRGETKDLRRQAIELDRVLSEIRVKRERSDEDVIKSFQEREGATPDEFFEGEVDPFSQARTRTRNIIDTLGEVTGTGTAEDLAARAAVQGARDIRRAIDGNEITPEQAAKRLDQLEGRLREFEKPEGEVREVEPELLSEDPGLFDERPGEREPDERPGGDREPTDAELEADLRAEAPEVRTGAKDINELKENVFPEVPMEEVMFVVPTPDGKSFRILRVDAEGKVIPEDVIAKGGGTFREPEGHNERIRSVLNKAREDRGFKVFVQTEPAAKRPERGADLADTLGPNPRIIGGNRPAGGVQKFGEFPVTGTKALVKRFREFTGATEAARVKEAKRSGRMDLIRIIRDEADLPLIEALAFRDKLAEKGITDPAAVREAARAKAIEKKLLEETPAKDPETDELMENITTVEEADRMLSVVEGEELRQSIQARKEELQAIEDLNMGTDNPMANQTTVPQTLPQADPLTRKEIKQLNLRRVKQLRETIKNLSIQYGFPIRRGKLSHKFRGVFKIHSEVIRTQYRNDVQATLHEIGHGLDKRIGAQKRLGTKFDHELLDLGRVSAAESKRFDKAHLRSEGWAEFYRLSLINERDVIRRAPDTYEFLMQELGNNPELAKAHRIGMREAQDLMAMSSLERSAASIAWDRSEFSRRATTPEDWYTHWLDDLYPLQTMYEGIYEGNATSVLADFYKLKRMTRGSDIRATGWYNDGIRNQAGDKVSDGLKPIVRDLTNKGLIDIAQVYLKDKRILEDLAPRGKATPAEVEQAQANVPHLEKLYPEFQDLNSRLQKYTDALLDVSVEAGVLTAGERFAIQQANRFYTPFHRVFDEAVSLGLRGADTAERRSPFRLISGKTGEQTLPAFEALIMNTHSIASAIDNAAVNNAFAKAAEVDGKGLWVERLDAPKGPPSKITIDQIKAALKSQGLEIGEVTRQGEVVDPAEVVMNIFNRTGHFGPDEPVMTFVRNGKREYYRLDPVVFEALQGKPVAYQQMAMQALSGAAKVLRATATLTPNFIARNPAKDTVVAGVQSKSGFIPIVDSLIGFQHILRNTEEYQRWKDAGGGLANLVSGDRKIIQKELRQLGKTRRQVLVDNTIFHPIDLLRASSEIMENTTRVGEFAKARKKLRKEGMTDAEVRVEAGFRSREVTLDFARAGIEGRSLNQVSAFFNAGMQGRDKFVRTFRDDPKAAIAHTLMYVTLPSVVTWWAVRDDPRYKELREWEKRAYWHIAIPGKKNLARIPKPHGYGYAFGYSTEIALEHLVENDPDALEPLVDDLKRIPLGVINTMIPTLLQPPIEAFTGRDLWRDRDIVNTYMQDLPPEQQFTTWTSETSKELVSWLPDDLKFSPAKLDHIIHGYFSGWGRSALDATDFVGRQLSDEDNAAVPARPSGEGIPGVSVPHRRGQDRCHKRPGKAQGQEAGEH
jgi:hypothetical protein